MEADPTRFTVRILLAAVAVALAVFFTLWGMRNLSIISAFLASIITFLVSAIGLSVLSAALVAHHARRDERQGTR